MLLFPKILTKFDKIAIILQFIFKISTRILQKQQINTWKTGQFRK